MKPDSHFGPGTARADVQPTGPYKYYVLFALTLALGISTADRALPLVLLEPIRRELGLSDTQSGFMAGPAYSILFALGGIPLGLLADRVGRARVVAGCMVLWSTMIGLCGVAGSYLQLVAFRMGVGLGESGVGPGSMAIVSGAFPERRRAFVVSVLYLGSPLGSFLALGGGAWLAASHGWRSTFIVAGAAGVALAGLLALTVRDPNPVSRGGDGAAAPPFREVVAFMLRQRSLIHLLMGALLSQAVAMTMASFQTSLLMRSYGLSLKQAGASLALIMSIAPAVSHLSAGWLADHLALRDERWRARLCTLGTLGAALGLSLVLGAPSVPAAIACLAFYHLFQPFYNGLVLANIQSLVPPRMRATAGAVNFVMLMIGSGIGPLVVGMTSDALAPVYGSHALRYALLTGLPFYAWALVHFWLSEKTLPAEFERAKAAVA